ncbi:zinc ABC transporter substrate-binding protein [Bartonella tamiae]|uniref:High-affinity zinc uptake system protein ZnuA n=1 Tax=Bartonella tamiae Th239 TaxID=1094558 RepID=J0ZLN3_9HYPH|nr:zinc ABC transporter substrate-binding protein [Bartonella tamiae]EJF89328.1 hypothetical protein ME5_01879 [Bartonella tamiae Th239]EJF92807.1 hypothetical protein MEG_01977 [Bartonella tamiae Th307]
MSFRLLSQSITIIIVFICSIFTVLAAPIPRIAVSIKPLHSLVSAVIGDLGTADLIVKGAGSEHSYTLKPSDAEILSKADVIFIANPDMERFLQKPIASLNAQNRLFALSEAPKIKLLPIREGGHFESHQHGKHESHHATDFHFWLDPDNAQKVVLYIADILSQKDSEHATIYQANALEYNTKLKNLKTELNLRLEAVRDKNFIVFHDAFQYFEKSFHLHAVGAVALDPERQPGAKRINTIRNIILKDNVVCIFSEPQFPNKLLNIVTENTSAQQGILDPLGMSVKEGSALYPQMMRALSQNIVDCLSKA